MPNPPRLSPRATPPAPPLTLPTPMLRAGLRHLIAARSRVKSHSITGATVYSLSVAGPRATLVGPATDPADVSDAWPPETRRAARGLLARQTDGSVSVILTVLVDGTKHCTVIAMPAPTSWRATVPRITHAVGSSVA